MFGGIGTAIYLYFQVSGGISEGSLFGWFILIYIPLYIVGIICFAYVHESDRRKYTIPFGAIFPFLIAAIYFMSIKAVYIFFSEYSDEAIFLAIFPSIIVSIVFVRVINSKLLK